MHVHECTHFPLYAQGRAGESVADMTYVPGGGQGKAFPA